MRKIFTLLLLFFILMSIIAFADTTHDTLSVDESVIQEEDNDDSENDLLAWMFNNLGILIGASATILAAVLGAIIAGRYAIKAKKMEKETSDENKILREELDKLRARDIHQQEVKKKVLKTEEDRYLDFIIEENEKLTFHGFETKVRVPILLWDVYIPLRVNLAGAGTREPGMEMNHDLQDNKILSVEQAVNLASQKNYDGLVILGDPGAGKTTLLKYFLLCFAKKEAAQKLNLAGDYLPVMLPLRNVNMEHKFTKALCEPLQCYDLNISEEFFKNKLEDGKIIMLLDGLDEVATEAARVKMCAWIHKARKRYHKCPFVITSRFTGYRGEVRMPGTYLELHARDFEKEDIQKFLHSWYTAVETSLHEDNNQWRTKARNAAEDLYKKIEESPAYIKLSNNPLMLQLIALVHYDSRGIPDRRVELYEQCVNLLLEKWDRAKGLKTLLSAKEAREVLQPVALWMHSEDNRRQEKKDKLINQMSPHLQKVKPNVDAEKFLTSIRDRSGLFVGYGTESYGFQHLSFQEYLTAEEIRNKSKSDILIKHFDESWWREPTLLAFGLSNPSIFEPFMDHFLISSKNNGAAADFMLKCVNEALSKSEAPFERVLLDESIPWQKRYNALLCLEVIESDEAKTIVKKVLSDKQPDIADKARQMLIKWDMLKAGEKVETDAKTGLPTRIYSPLEDNAEYILIPGGTYTMGKLKKKVTLKPFYMAKYPVTNRLYKIFMKESGHNEPEYFNDKRFNGDDQPVVGVTKHDADAYCKWLTESNTDGQPFRLPTEEEWEWAAGGGKRIYPWGDEKPTEDHANYAKKVGQTTPVGSYPKGATPEGLLDMAGNVWEWTDNWYDKNESTWVLRGGSWVVISGSSLRCAFRYSDIPSFRDSSFGFRCVQGSP